MAQSKKEKAEKAKAARAKAKAAKAAEAKVTEVKPTRTKAEFKNGARKPLKDDSKCGQVWVAATKLTKNDKIPTIQELLVVTDKLGLTQSNVRMEYQSWRTFYGHSPIWKGKKAA